MRICLLISLLFFMACSEKNKLPKGILSQQKMENVLWDLIRADEFVLNYVTKDTLRNSKKERLKLYAQIFSIHGIDKDKFQKSFSYYEGHPELLQPLMDSLETKKKQETEVKPKPWSKDSLMKSKVSGVSAQ